MKKFLFISSVVASLFFLDSCKKNKNTYDNSNAPKTNAIIENAFDEMTNMTDQAITGNMIFYKSGKVTVYDLASAENMVVEKAACSVIITLDTLSSPKAGTIEWGNTN